ncbi:hypothetical protein CR969_00685 [Candidatus Saccharibacteria bacterium]|nr:MAG: hypothetical protein CR969_00685 [Candidatus Saccharibacteria bacterium]
MSDTNRLHIAIFTDDFYPASGGIGRSIQTQINELVNRGHKVTLFAPKHNLEKPDSCQIFVTPSFYPPGAPSHMCILSYNNKLAKKICSEYKFDIVHSQTERGGLMLAAKISKIQNIPHIHTFHANLAGTHASQPFSAFWGSLAYFILVKSVIATIAPQKIGKKVKLLNSSGEKCSFLERFDWYSLATVASRVDHYTAPSRFMVENIGNHLPGSENYRSAIPTGVSKPMTKQLGAKLKKSKDKPLRFISISRLSKEKRVDIIIKAFKKADIPNSELVVVGSGDQLRTLKQLANGSANIYLQPHSNDMNHIIKQYQRADVFVLASYRFETQGMVLSEAAAAHLPIIYCDERLDVGVGKTNSILTDSPDSDSLAEAMRQMTDKKLRQKLSAGSAKLVPTLSVDFMATNYLKVYNQSIKQKSLDQQVSHQLSDRPRHL